MFKIGFDIGSTTIKGVVLDERDELIYLFYHRHLSNVANAIDFALDELQAVVSWKVSIVAYAE